MSAKLPDAVDVHVGRRVRLRRMMLGISQQKLGDALGISFQQVQKYEKGLNRMAASRLAQIARALSCSIGFLLEGLDGLETDGQTAIAPKTAFAAEAADPLSVLGATAEGLALAQAFLAIGDEAQRKAIVAMAQACAALKQRSARAA